MHLYRQPYIRMEKSYWKLRRKADSIYLLIRHRCILHFCDQRSQIGDLHR